MSSIYEALKRTQLNRNVSSGGGLRGSEKSHRIYWVVIAAVILGSVLTTAVLYGVGVIGRGKSEVHQSAAHTGQADPERIIDLMNRAERLQTKGMTDEAAQVYLQVVSLNPSFSEAYLKLGSLYYANKIYDKAFETYSRAHKMRPNDARLLNNMGSVLLAKGDPAKALTFFTQARRCSADYVEPLYNMACAYARLKKNDAALSSLRQACTMQPEARLWARRDPDLAPLRGHKEFEDIIRVQ